MDISEDAWHPAGSDKSSHKKQQARLAHMASDDRADIQLTRPVV